MNDPVCLASRLWRDTLVAWYLFPGTMLIGPAWRVYDRGREPSWEFRFHVGCWALVIDVGRPLD